MSGSNDENWAGGCGCLLLILFGAAIHFQVDIGQFFNSLGNVVKVILAVGAVVLVLGLLGAALPDESTDKSGEKEKSKRKEKPKRIREPDRVFFGDDHAQSISRSQERSVSRLEVPGGYVPFEMTKTKTKTKDTEKTETKIKTYVDSREVKAIISGKDVDLLSDGER